MSVSRFTFYWDIQNNGKYTGVPTLQASKNDLDAHGTFFDLKRLPAEDNPSYYKRLQSVLPLRGGADHDGLVHGITRELGLEEKIGIKISPVSLGGSWIAQSPYVEITASQLILYNSYIDATTNTVDKTINIFDHGTGYLVEDIISEIQSSEYFVAELGVGMTGKEKANGLFPGSSAGLIEKEWVPASSYFFLENNDVIPGTLYFSEKQIFAKELSPSLASTTSSGLSMTWTITTPAVLNGQYYVDYEEGIVTAKQSASGRGTCRYLYRDFPWYIRWSPVAVYSLRDSSYRTKVFENEIMSNNSTRDGLVTIEGVDIYTQIFDNAPSLWGE